MSATVATEPQNGSPSAFRLINFAALHIGVPALARAIGIEERSVRAKLAGDRGVSDTDLSRTADALRRHAAVMVSQAEAIDARLGHG